ncbi:MAG: hypothetical protein D6785_11600 [Planctomycetota bacterium]|nr:MAG: hypothetical protein D6785_11600 [Planctomycetota bacterium]
MEESLPPHDLSESEFCPNCGLILTQEKECYCIARMELDVFQENLDEKEKKLEKWYQFFLEQGEYWLKAGKTEISKTYLLKALSLCPERPEATLLLQKGEEKIREGHFLRLVEEGEKLVEEGNLGGAKAKWETALIFQESKEIQEKLEELCRQLNEEEFILLKEEGLRFYEAGALREAYDCLNKALDLKEDQELVEIFKNINDILDKVQEILTEAEQLSQRGKWKEALKKIEEGFKLYPEDHELLVTAAFLTSQRDEYWSKLREAKGEWKSFHFFKALQLFQELLLISPKDISLKIQVFLLSLHVFLLFFLGSCLMIWLFRKSHFL